MIFIGDISSPSIKTSNDLYESLQKTKQIFDRNTVIGNLEGLLMDEFVTSNETLIYSNSSILESLSLINTKLLSLANNHVLDFPSQIDFTQKKLDEFHISYCGADKSKTQAQEAIKLDINGVKTYFLSYSWDVLMQHQKNEDGKLFVNIFDPTKCLNDVKKLRNTDTHSKIVLLMHWGFDLEILPFPLYRRLSQSLIDAGANAIIGSHSHCVQGGERYKDGVIIYSLGNFFFPWYEYRNGTSYFPEWTTLELALDWEPKSNRLMCHWFNYQYSKGKHVLHYVDSEDFDSGSRIIEYSPYRSMNHDMYIKWFKNHRRKGFLLPVYLDHEDVLRNKLIDYYIKNRVRFARYLAKHKLRNWNH